MADSGEDVVYYHYNPVLWATITACVLFAISSILHTYQMIRCLTMYMIPMVIGVIIEAAGYGARAASAIEAPDFSLGPYIVQSVLILISPALFAASVYMILGYIILTVDGEHHAMIRKKFLTKIFVLGDICSFMIQSTGAGLITKKDPDAPTVGKYIIVGGLLVQLLFFGFFMVVSVVFYRRLNRMPTRRSQSGEVAWRPHMWLLFTASLLIWIRSVFRVVEYVQGPDGYLLSHEIYMYIFDAILMAAVVLLFNIVHPSQITALLTGRRAVYQVLRVERKTKLVSQEEEVEEQTNQSRGVVPMAALGHSEYAPR